MAAARLRLALLFAQPHFVFIHAEIMSVFVPDSLGDDGAHLYSVFVCRIFYRQLIERDGVWERGADAIGVTARGIRNALIQTEKCLISGQALSRTHLLRRFILDQKCDILNLRAEFLRQKQESLLHQLFKSIAVHGEQCTSHFVPHR